MLECDNGVIPSLLNGSCETLLLKRPTRDTIICIEDRLWRVARIDSEEASMYQNQGLHTAFFKRLESIWKDEASVIRAMRKEICEHILSLLKEKRVKDTQIVTTMTRVSDRLRQEGTLARQLASKHKTFKI